MGNCCYGPKVNQYRHFEKVSGGVKLNISKKNNLKNVVVSNKVNQNYNNEQLSNEENEKNVVNLTEEYIDKNKTDVVMQSKLNETKVVAKKNDENNLSKKINSNYKEINTPYSTTDQISKQIKNKDQMKIVYQHKIFPIYNEKKLNTFNLENNKSHLDKLEQIEKSVGKIRKILAKNNCINTNSTVCHCVQNSDITTKQYVNYCPIPYQIIPIKFPNDFIKPGVLPVTINYNYSYDKEAHNVITTNRKKPKHQKLYMNSEVMQSKIKPRTSLLANNFNNKLLNTHNNILNNMDTNRRNFSNCSINIESDLNSNFVYSLPKKNISSSMNNINKEMFLYKINLSTIQEIIKTDIQCEDADNEYLLKSWINNFMLAISNFDNCVAQVDDECITIEILNHYFNYFGTVIQELNAQKFIPVDNNIYYKGNLKNGLACVLLDKNTTFTGTFRNGFADGFGKFQTDEVIYLGYFNEGYMENFGIYENLFSIYIGYFDKSIPNGNALEIIEDGTTYYGEYYNGYKHGKGTLYFVNTASAICNFAFGKVTDMYRANDLR